MDRRRRIAAAAVVAAALAIGAGLAVSPVLAATKSVSISGFAFHPKSVTITVGDRITWTNNDAAAHTATSSGDFDTGTIASGASKSVTFGSAGTFSYICTIHPSMTGIVLVRAAGSGGAAPNTDALPAEGGLDAGTLALILGGLGVVMIVWTLVVERLLHGRSAR
jgi:plastocyanin